MTIKEMREKTYLSQAKFAQLLEIPVANVAKWEQGVSSPPEYVEKLIGYRLLQIGILNVEDFREEEKHDNHLDFVTFQQFSIGSSVKICALKHGLWHPQAMSYPGSSWVAVFLIVDG